jgi:hypothetical protein
MCDVTLPPYYRHDEQCVNLGWEHFDEICALLHKARPLALQDDQFRHLTTPDDPAKSFQPSQQQK